MAKKGLTTGVKNALAKRDHHSMCECGFALPKYPGRYPKTCPSCGTERAQPSESRVVQVGTMIDEGLVLEVDGNVAYVEDSEGNTQEVNLG